MGCACEPFIFLAPFSEFSHNILCEIVGFIDPPIGLGKLLALRQGFRVFPDEPILRTRAVVQPVLHIICMEPDPVKMRPNIAFGHHETDRPDLLSVLFRKILLPVGRDIDTLHDQVLIIFNDGLDHLPEDGPEFLRKRIVIIHRQLRPSASDQSHFQMVNGQIWILQFLQQALRRRVGKGVTFVIAQRVSAIADSDLILVMEDGAIVGQGTHQELIRNNEVYRGIVASQWGEEAIA